MDTWHTLLLWVHFASIAAGGAASVGIPVVGAAMRSAPAEARPALGGVAMKLSVIGRTALGLLIVTGALLIWSGSGTNGWFWIKLTLVALLIAGVVLGLRAGAQARGGDSAAAARGAMIGKVNILIFVLIVLAAVLAFG